MLKKLFFLKHHLGPGLCCHSTTRRVGRNYARCTFRSFYNIHSMLKLIDRFNDKRLSNLYAKLSFVDHKRFGTFRAGHPMVVHYWVKVVRRFEILPPAPPRFENIFRSDLIRRYDPHFIRIESSWLNSGWIRTLGAIPPRSLTDTGNWGSKKNPRIRTGRIRGSNFVLEKIRKKLRGDICNFLTIETYFVTYPLSSSIWYFVYVICKPSGRVGWFRRITEEYFYELSSNWTHWFATNIERSPVVHEVK